MSATCERTSKGTASTQIDVHVLLPEVADARDACVHRLGNMLTGRVGISLVHEDGANVCIHFDRERVTLAEVERLAKAAGSEITHRYGHAVLPVRLVDGEDSGRRIEQSLRCRKGILSASVSLPAQVARVEWDRQVIDRHEVETLIRDLGINAPAKIGCCDHGPGEDSHEAPSTPGWLSLHRELVWSLLSGGVLAITFTSERAFGLNPQLAIAGYAVSYFLGGFDLAAHWIKAAIRAKPTFDIDLLMLLAAMGAAILGNWAEGAFLLFLFSLAHALEHYALERARNAISALSDLAPETAIVVRDGEEREVPIADVAIGETVFILPGTRVPVDGTVTSGLSAVDQAPITGESVPVEKAVGDAVFAGTINGEGALQVISTSPAGERTLDRVIRMVEEAQTQKAPTEQFVTRFSRWFVPIVLIADVLVIVVPPLVGALTWSESFYRGMALLVAASPCALALGTPSAVLAGIAQAARNGVLIKGGAHLENLGNIRAMAFDKTGTLTTGKPEVTDVERLEATDDDVLLGVAAAVERRSQHPLAEAVVRRAEGAPVWEANDIQSITGRGLRGTVDGRPIEVGSLRMWEGVEIPDSVRQATAALTAKGRTVMIVWDDGKWLGLLGLADRPRPRVRETLGRLRKLGINPLVMLTGDNRGVGEAVGQEVGVDEVRADLLPEDKVTAIRELSAKYRRVGMIGDGVNDAPALTNATVGIAMGGAGTAVALETADVALMGDDLEKLPFAVGLARTSSWVIKQNLFVALTVIATLVTLTIAGWLRIGPAVIFHEGSTLVVLANSLRLLAYRGR